MTSFLLKVIAFICMVCDHLGKSIFIEFKFLRYIGHLAFPIFCFQLVQGYLYTGNKIKFMKRLFMFALISQVPFCLFMRNVYVFNVMFTLLFGIIAIAVYDMVNKILGIFSLVLLCFVAQFLNFDYGAFGVIIIFAFYIFRNNKIYMSLIFIVLVILNYSFNYKIPIKYLFYSNGMLPYVVFTCFSLVPILLYNNKKGRDTKYLFYILYPLHFIILIIIMKLKYM